MKQFLISSIALLFFTNANAQLPNSDVWLFSYSVKSGNYSFADGKNISNKTGYDNQPFFSKDGMQLLFTSEQDSGQTDIFQYDLKNGKSHRIIHTSVSEYSPEYFSGNRFISDVVVEKDSTQRLWQYDSMDDYDHFETKILLPNVKNVAYSRWFNDSIVFLCILPEPMNLFVANINTQVISKCAMHVDRSMAIYHQKNRDLFLYSQMKADSSYVIQALSNTGAPVSEFGSIPFVKGSMDFSIDKKGNIFMASGTKLFIWTVGKSKEWKEIEDFASQGLHKITRLTISPDGKHIALVDNTK
ncbi:MAG: hypothetical protein NT084_14785 [Bacteroidetes bacterium]|jgi:hypothetical protein|nr:hypothetical protein [Bacteroidota bacterium]